MKHSNKPFSGRHALIWLLVCFGLVVTVNGIMIGLAIYSDPERRSAVTSEQLTPAEATVQANLAANGSRR